MTARASIYYDCNHLRDVLLIEDVGAELAVGSGDRLYSSLARVQINLDDDQLVDDLVKALTKLQRDAAKQRLAGQVRRLQQEQSDAIRSRRERHQAWTRADELLNETQSKLAAAEKALDELISQEEV